MKAVLISTSFFTIFFLLFSSLVNSQTDSCNSKLNINAITFETTSLKCLSVWDSQNFILRYGQSRSNASLWSFVLSAPDPGSFVAIGFSKGGRMVGSTAVVGWVSGGSPYIKRYYLGGTTPAQVEADKGDVTVVGDTATVVAGTSRLYVAFQLSLAAGETPENRLLYSIGPEGFYPVQPSFRLTQHRDRVATTINYSSGTSKSKSSPHLKLRRSHGIFNMIGWGILTIIGVMVARYCRQHDPLWFYVHASVQSIGLLMGISGVLCGFLLDNRLHVNVSTHKGLGVFIFVLGCIQAMALMIRPHKTAKNRKYWNWFHYSVGRILLVFAIANIFYGIKLGSEGQSWTASYALILCFLFICSCVLEYRLWANGKN